MSGAEDESDRRWTLGVRAVEGQIDRATLRTTLTYRIIPRVQIGIEYNPLDDDVSPLGNVLAVTETERRPALMLGTSSDRIGTPSGQSYYATLSKDLEHLTELPLAPYVGASYGTFKDEWLPIAGMNVRLTERLSSLVLFDGVNVHPTMSYSLGRHVLSFLLVEGRHPGFSYSITFAGPERRLRSDE